MRAMTPTENDFLIAATRLWQAIEDGRLTLTSEADGGPAGLDYVEDITTNCYNHAPLAGDGIETMLEEVFGIV